MVSSIDELSCRASCSTFCGFTNAIAFASSTRHLIFAAVVAIFCTHAVHLECVNRAKPYVALKKFLEGDS
jgi:hypothetical protein